MTILLVITSIISGASVALHAIAPLTKSTKDDRVLAALKWIEGALAKLSLNKASK